MYDTYGLKRFTKYVNYPYIVTLRNAIAEKAKTENKYYQTAIVVFIKLEEI